MCALGCCMWLQAYRLLGTMSASCTAGSRSMQYVRSPSSSTHLGQWRHKGRDATLALLLSQRARDA
jgi:hypothetical protein